MVKKIFSKKVFAFALSIAAIFGFSTLALAQGGTATGDVCTPPTDIKGVFQLAICLLTRYVVPFLFALALVMFLIGVLQYVAGGDNEEKREAGRNMMVFGIIALFVMISVWGLVKILHSTLFGTGGTAENQFQIPGLPAANSNPFQIQ